MLANNKKSSTNQPQPTEDTADNVFNWATKILTGRAFRMKDKVEDVFRNIFSRSLHLGDDHPDKPKLCTMYSWLIAPFTLWPIDMNGLSRFVYSQIKRKKKLEPEMDFLLSLVKTLPSEKAQQVIGDFEHVVQHGAYDQLVRDDAKYLARLQELLNNAEFHADLAMLKKFFDLSKYQTPDSKQILRRTQVCERNMRPGFLFRWASKAEQFQQIFDCFCWKYHLYGMEGDKPLLMKLTVNPTPHGLMIYIPAWMSFDLWRDLVHSKITDLIRARGVLRQGPKFSEGRLQTKETALAVYLAWVECEAKNIVGKERLKYITEKAGLPPQKNDRTIRKLRALGEEMFKAESAHGRPTFTRQDADAVNGARLAQAKASAAALTAEEKAEFMKWLAA